MIEQNMDWVRHVPHLKNVCPILAITKEISNNIFFLNYWEVLNEFFNSTQ